MTSIWRLQLRPGSFRGVAFECDKHDFEGGRRIVDHLFPYRDIPWTEDFGRKQRIYRLNIYVIGTDYFSARDALIDALEKGGPAILLHPYLGSKTVEAGDFTVSESNEQGGMALISVTFRETGRIPAPVGLTDTLGDLKSKANAVQLALLKAMAYFKTPATASYLLESATSLVRQVSDTLYTASSSLPNTGAGIADLGYAIRNLKGNARVLAQKPNTLGRSIIDAIKGVTSVLNINGLLPEDDNGRVIIPPGPVASEGMFKRSAFLPILVLPTLLPPTLHTTPTRRQQRVNQETLSRLVVGSAVSELAIVSVSTDYESFSAAVAQRDLILKYIRSLLEDPGLDDESYNAIQALAASVVNALPDVRASYPRLSLLKLYDLTPSLLVSYNLYGDVSKEYDIISRNHIANPAFISPVNPLEVIAND